MRPRKTNNPSFWTDDRSAALPKAKRHAGRAARSSTSHCREQRNEALESELERLTIVQGIARWSTLGVYFRLSGACIESIGIVADVPYPATLSRWIRENDSEIRKQLIS